MSSGSWDSKICQWETVGLRRLLDAIKSGDIESLLQNSSVFSLAEDSMRIRDESREKTRQLAAPSTPSPLPRLHLQPVDNSQRNSC
jgi:hypothetical protein